MRDFNEKAQKHLAAMLEAGGHYSVFLVTPTNIIPFSRYIRRFLTQRLGRIVDYRLFWFSTSKGYVVCLSADITVRRLIGALYERAVKLKYITSAEQLYIGANAKTLTNTVQGMAEHYTASPSITVRTYGGSSLRGNRE